MRAAETQGNVMPQGDQRSECAILGGG